MNPTPLFIRYRGFYIKVTASEWEIKSPDGSALDYGKGNNCKEAIEKAKAKIDTFYKN